MKAFSKACILLATLTFPVITYAALFNVQPGDKSLEYLAMVFGEVPGSIPSGYYSIFGTMAGLFNQAVFGLGIVVISYTIMMGAINTAHEGQFLGKNWHPILVPFRAGVGILLLIPQASGYNAIQMMVMWLVLQGVGAANSMWNVVVNKDTPLHKDTRKEDLQDAQGLVTNILKANNCMNSLNAGYDTNEDLKERLVEKVSFYISGNTVKWGRRSYGDAICGYIDVYRSVNPTFTGAGTTVTGQQRTAVYINAISKAQNALMAPSFESLMVPMDFGSVGELVNAARQLREDALKTADITFQAQVSLNDEAKQNGWLLAGSYYYALTQSGTRRAVSFTSLPDLAPASDLATTISQPLYDQYVASAITAAGNYVTTGLDNMVTVETWERSGPSILLSPRPSGSAEGTSIFAAIFGSLFEQITLNLQSQITGAGEAGKSVNNDPLVAMTKFGSDLTLITENVFFAALGLAFALWMVSTFMSCLQPFAHAFNFLLTIIMPIAMLMISLLWVAGLTLGIYVPMIPYLVFTFSALTWIILVIEAMLAAPLIALTLIVPSEDEIGKAGHAIVILLGVFLRPALMILGFILASQLLIVGIGMLNAAFWSTMMSSTGGSLQVGVFGLIAILLLYASVAVAMVHEAFSLIYLVPNKVMRWIGGGGNEDEGTMKNVQSLKGSVQKGAGIGAGLMKSSLKAFKK